MLLWLPFLADAQQSCRVLNSTLLDFGTVSTAGNSSSSATLTISCQGFPGVPVQVTVCIFVDEGLPTGMAPRRMGNDAGAFMAYDLYANAARTQLIGPFGRGYDVFYTFLSVPITGSTQINLTAYGRVPPGQNLPAAYRYENVMSPGLLRYVFAAPLGGASSGENCRDGVAPAFGSAGQSTFTFGDARARVADNCIITLASDLDFGTVIQLDGPRDASSLIQLRCATDTAWSVTLGKGLNATASGVRRMISNGNFLQYALYKDPALLLPWGDTQATAVTDTGENENVSLTVYGRVFPQPAAVPGSYRDTITVTLTY
ncbi:Csu type fimbrial protein [Stenotrophomonas terrae]|uniref:Csu type fimbrial protein n=1 Tax=Stenotrophomonas terrae TaxID=405446 RepID=UPI00070D1AD2|nr:spore coat U domain-containing protein [Stenotrophomonas terrae]